MTRFLQIERTQRRKPILNALDARDRLEKAQSAANLAGSLAIGFVADLTDAKVVERALASAKAAAEAIKAATQN